VRVCPATAMLGKAMPKLHVNIIDLDGKRRQANAEHATPNRIDLNQARERAKLVHGDFG